MEQRTQHDPSTRAVPDPHPLPDASTREAGFTLLEMTVTAVITVSMVWLVSTLSLSGMRAQKLTERMARVTEITQDVIDDMRSGLTSSIRLFGNDAVGQGYMDLMTLDASMTPWIAGTRLPSVRTNARIEPETALDPRTGNALLYARYAWTHEFESTAGNVYRLDVYRLEMFGLTTGGRGPGEGRPDGLNLAQWVSEPMVDGSQIDRIDDPIEQAEALIDLLSGAPDRDGQSHDPIQVVWLVGADPADPQTLRQIESVGTLSEDSVFPRESAWEILPAPGLIRADILDYRHHSVATAYAPLVVGVGRFAQRSLSTMGGMRSPLHGFEVQVVGPSSSRQVLLHLSLITTRASDHRAWHDMQIIVDIRDV